ncbi:MAG: acetyltransferase component of pyruvate dehydrogenase complex [Anaerolineaceae bacterium]|nr:MAG: dihydrolipoamide acetyltransferase family protein [Anaerolineales bacterium]GIK08617.1 MAG: acetyltransferase component of pyruvate dehydrogenase complex [Chloroflexota bacterium]GJQ39097.1 MAG: acetyltransferase component of pyruvate dehydrogenase complex [Anaerolineaceae bacterium]HMN00831.1 dihydrolipoamide acetyltransferase family protein [Anaerolineales bacterium]
MAETINMPKLGFDMAEGTLIRWVKQVGETIHKGDVLAEIETDKATVEVESPASGVVLQLIVSQGDVVPVNAPIAVVGQAGEEVSVQSSVSSDQLSVTSDQLSVSSVQKADAALPPAGTAPTPPARGSGAQAVFSPEAGGVKASPLAKKIARDNNVNLAALQGTGPGGRVVKRDVEAALVSVQSSVISDQSAVIGSQFAQPSYQVAVAAEDKVVPTTKLRQAIGRRLVESKQTVPHFYVTHEYKMDMLLEMRKQFNAYLPEDEKISVNDFIVKAAALTLRQFPNLNATIKGNEVIQFGHVNVGVAVTVPGGLMTVVVKDADQKMLRQISAEVKAMAARAREGKVKPDDVDGSTFSTSNLGMYDVEDFIAIINPPEAAILAISSAREVPVAEDGQVKIGWRMKATISVDHRVSDGAEAAQFMQKLAEFLENPVMMLV